MPVTSGAQSTEANLNSTTPAAGTGKRNVEWQAGSPYADPNNPGYQIRDISAEIPNIGYVDARSTTSETIALASRGKTVTFGDASPAAPIAVALDSTVPDDFECHILNESSQTVTLTPSSGDINDGTGAASSKTLAAGASCKLSKTSSGSPVVAHWKMLKGVSVAAGLAYGEIGVVIDGAGSVPSTGSKKFIQAPFGGTITGWTIIADVSGSCQITVKKSAYSGFPTTASIVASAPPVLTTAQKATSTTLTGWTTTFSAGDIFEFNLDSVSTCKWILLVLQVTKA